MFILKKGHQPGVYVPFRALFLVVIGHEIISTTDLSKTILNYWLKDVHWVLVNCLG